jgi:hypothetical protein
VDEAYVAEVIKAYVERLIVLLREPCSIKEWSEAP